MIQSKNNELMEFNNSKKNLKRISNAKGFIFISCPDFSHECNKYTFQSISNEIPLSLSLVKQTLLLLQEQKPVLIYLSDHEAERIDVLSKLRITKEFMKECICKSMEATKLLFREVALLSTLYSYEVVVNARQNVPEDSHLQSALIQWIGDGGSIVELTSRYKEKYAQMYIFMEYCNRNNLCPLFMYSKFNLNLVSNIRKIIAIPALFLDCIDPH